MNEYGEGEPAEETRPPEAAPAPTWEWTGTQSGPTSPMGPPPGGAPQYGGYGGYGTILPPVVPALATTPEGPSRRISRRTRGLGVAAALLLVGGAAAGGAAFGFAHGQDGSSASGIASGENGTSSPAVPGQNPSQGPAETPNGGGNGKAPHHHRGGRPSSYVPPGHASTDQQTGVVDINTKLKYESAKAAGTGMVLTANGEILTNNHVIQGATKIRVIVVSTGKKYTASVVGTDRVDDIAVLQLAGASGLATITPDTHGVSVGDPITAVGNAMGAGGIPSAAEGHVIGLDRSITTRSEGSVQGERLTGMIQVDAQVIAGDSGGPLYDAQNEVIGMDTAASSSPMQSLGFAIPIDKALSIAQQIQSGQEGGNITLGVPGFLGIQYTPGSSAGGSGAVVTGVVPKTPAAGISLIPGDTIVSIDGSAVTSGEQLKTLLAHYHGGDSVSLTWKDSQGGSHTATVTLIDGPAE